MATGSTAIEYFVSPGAVLIVLPVAGCCGGCHTARYNFISRNGRTVCLTCDQKRTQGDVKCAGN